MLQTAELRILGAQEPAPRASPRRPLEAHGPDDPHADGPLPEVVPRGMEVPDVRTGRPARVAGAMIPRPRRVATGRLLGCGASDRGSNGRAGPDTQAGGSFG